MAVGRGLRDQRHQRSTLLHPYARSVRRTTAVIAPATVRSAAEADVLNAGTASLGSSHPDAAPGRGRRQGARLASGRQQRTRLQRRRTRGAGVPGADDHTRTLVEQLVLGLATHRHKDLAAVCTQLGLPEPPPEGPVDDTAGARDMWKRERLQAVFHQLEPAQHAGVLRRFLEQDIAPVLRNQAQDLLWAQEQWPTVDERARRETAESLERGGGLAIENPAGLMALLRRLFILEDELSGWTGQSLASDVERHVLGNPGDWTVLDLFTRMGALTCADRRFILLLQGLLSANVCPDEPRQREMAATITPALARVGLRIEHTGQLGGYPDFSLVRTGAPSRPPQLILFASTARKPDLRLAEVLDEQVEVVSSSTDVLRYDKPVGDEGLTWNHLQSWWADRGHLTPEDAHRSLWQRLRAAVLAARSPPQLALFDEYHDVYGKRGGPLFAMLPEVWLHWDPVTKRNRGNDALPAQRMDFLMLLSGRRRVVLEVDGVQHYSQHDRPSPAAYAETMRANRGLQLSKYEVFRFGGHELAPERAHDTVTTFFDRLLGPTEQ